VFYLSYVASKSGISANKSKVEVAQHEIQKSQKFQKEYHDRRATTLKVHVGDRDFVYFPVDKTGKAYKFVIEYFNYMTTVLK